jgi:hypothetical protein
VKQRLYPTVDCPGWFLVADTEESDAHYYSYFKALNAIPICGAVLPQGRRWELPRDIGVVHLCEMCKRFLVPPTRERLVVEIPDSVELALKQLAADNARTLLNGMNRKYGKKKRRR